MMRHGCVGGRKMATSKPSRSRHPLQYFPRLDADNHRTTSPVSRQYNCIAWAAGIDNLNVWPSGADGLLDEPEITWPEGIRNDESIAAFVAYFESLGYALCDGPDFEAGFLKIAIFAKDGYPTHACRQLPSQKWTSKMSWDGVDIEHNDLECIAGDRYGTASVFLKRPTTVDSSNGD